MKTRLLSFVAQRPGVVVFVVLLVLMLAVGAVGEVAAHNPGGQEVPVCEHGHPGHNHWVGDTPAC